MIVSSYLLSVGVIQRNSTSVMHTKIIITITEMETLKDKSLRSLKRHWVMRRHIIYKENTIVIKSHAPNNKAVKD